MKFYKILFYSVVLNTAYQSPLKLIISFILAIYNTPVFTIEMLFVK